MRYLEATLLSARGLPHGVGAVHCVLYLVPPEPEWTHAPGSAAAAADHDHGVDNDNGGAAPTRRASGSMRDVPSQTYALAAFECALRSTRGQVFRKVCRIVRPACDRRRLPVFDADR